MGAIVCRQITKETALSVEQSQKPFPLGLFERNGPLSLSPTHTPTANRQLK